MKKVIFFLALMAGISTSSQAQLKLPGGTEDLLKNFIAPPKFDDAGKTASGIADLLAGKLKLTGDEKKGTLDAVTDFLGKKKGFLNLADSDPAGYLKKFNPLQKGLFGKLQGILGAAKFANFLKLKPGGNGVGNLLSNLFF